MLYESHDFRIKTSMSDGFPHTFPPFSSLPCLMTEGKTAIDPLIHTHQVAAAWRRRGFHVGGPGTATAAVPDRPSSVALWL